MKIYDKINDEFLYKNKITGVITSKKPVFLGKEDLPEPKSYEAPLNYDPGLIYMILYLLCIQTINACTYTYIYNICGIIIMLDHPIIILLPRYSIKDNNIIITIIIK